MLADAAQRFDEAVVVHQVVRWDGTVDMTPKLARMAAVAPRHVYGLPYLLSMRESGSVIVARCACATRHDASPRERKTVSAPRMLLSASALGSSCVRTDRSTYAFSLGTPRPSRYAHTEPSVAPKALPHTVTWSRAFA